MSKDTAPKGKAVSSLVKAYANLVHSGDQGVRDWFRKAQKVNVRDFEATIVEAKKFGEVRGITKNSARFVKVIVAAFDLEGADKVSVYEISKVAEVAQRALKIEAALVLVGKAKSFDDFKEKAEAARDMKAEAEGESPNAGRRSSKKAESADEIISNALEGLRDLVDVTVTDFDSASDLIKLVNSLVANSRQLLADTVERHPAKGA